MISVQPPGSAVTSRVLAASKMYVLVSLSAVFVLNAAGSPVLTFSAFSTTAVTAPAFPRTPQIVILSDRSRLFNVSPVSINSLPETTSSPSSFTRLRARSFAESPSGRFPVVFTTFFLLSESSADLSCESSPVSSTCFNCTASAKNTFAPTAPAAPAALSQTTALSSAFKSPFASSSAHMPFP